VRLMHRFSVRALRMAACAVIVGVPALLATNGSSASAKSTAAGSTITFGVLHPFTGAYASVGEASLEGATVAASEINAAGGILGRKLVIDHADTLADPVDAVPAARHLIALSSPSAIIGPGGLEITAVQSILDTAKIPFEFEGGDTALDHTNDPMLWRDTPSDSQEGVAMALYALKKHYKRAAFMMSSISSAQDFIPVIRGAFVKGGGKIVGNAVLTPSLSSYRSEVISILKDKPQVIFTQCEPPTAAVLTKNLKELNNLKIPLIATDTSTAPEWIKAVTPAVAHSHVFSVQGATVKSKASPFFLKYFKKEYPGQSPLASAPYAYDGTIALALAITKAKSTSGPTFAKDIQIVTSPPGTAVYSYKSGVVALKAGKKINYQGASGAMDYNKYHNVFGPFEVVNSTLSGKLKSIAVISGKAVQKGSP
jgi:ABC-type branched-subunit amino acid transport system substrate-binding protein